MCTVLPLPSNATTYEIIGHINHNYPDLGPALAQLLERLDDIASGVYVEDEQNISKIARCQHCGKPT